MKTEIKLGDKEVLIITGRQASGKSTLACKIAEGRGSYITISPRDLEGKFAVGNLLEQGLKTVIIEEEGVKIDYGLINLLVSEDTLVCERMYRRPEALKIGDLSFIVCTNRCPQGLEYQKFMVLDLGKGVMK